MQTMATNYQKLMQVRATFSVESTVDNPVRVSLALQGSRGGMKSHRICHFC